MAAVKRAAIERRLAQLQIDREREEQLLRRIEDGDVPSSEALAAADLKALAVASAITSIQVFGTTVAVGGIVALTTDQAIFRTSEATMPRKDILKMVYLGEPGRVLAVFDSYHGKPAVELKFADGSTFIFFADCLNVGDRGERTAVSKAAKTGGGASAGAAAAPQALTGGPSTARGTARGGTASADGAPSASPAAGLEPTLPRALPKRPFTMPRVFSAAMSPSYSTELDMLVDVASEASTTPLSPGPGRGQTHVDPHAQTQSGRRAVTPPLAARLTQPRVTSAPPASAAAKRPAPKAAPTAVSATVNKQPAAKPAAASTTTKPAATPTPELTRGSSFEAGKPRQTRAAVTSTPPPPPNDAAPQRSGGATPARSPVAPTRTTIPATSAPPAAATRPVTLRVYENGSYGDATNDRVPYRTVTIRPVHKTLASVLTLVATTLEWNGAGRKVDTLFDPKTGKAITTLSELQDNAAVVASMGDALVKPRPNSQLYASINPTSTRETEPAVDSKPAAARKPVVSPASSKLPMSTRTQQPAAATSTAAAAARPAKPTINRQTAASLLAEIKVLESRLEHLEEV
jgi:hypothetical protein